MKDINKVVYKGEFSQDYDKEAYYYLYDEDKYKRYPVHWARITVPRMFYYCREERWETSFGPREKPPRKNNKWGSILKHIQSSRGKTSLK